MRKTTDCHWLDMAEYVSLAGSVAGSVAAIAFQHMVYVAAPLTVALSLSLANRQRFQQQIQQITSAITESKQQIQQQTTAITDGKQQIQQQTTSAIADMHQVAEILGSELLAELTLLSVHIDQLSQQMRDLPPPFDFSSLEKRVVDLEQTNCTFETCLKGLFLSVNQLQSSTIPIESAIAQLKKKLEIIAQQFDA